MDELTQQIRSSARAMWRWRWIGLTVAWAVALIGAAALWRMPDRYEATARIYVDTQTVLKPLMAGLAVQPDINQQINMLARTMITRPNIERLMRGSDLDLTAHTPAQRDMMIEELTRGIRMTGGGVENIYDIRYRDPDPSRARRIVQAMVSMFVESGLGGKRRDSETARRFIDEQIKGYDVKLQQAENRLKEFKLQNFGYTGEPGTDYFARVGALNGELSRLRVELRAAEQSRDALRRELAGEEPVLLPEHGAGAMASVVPELDARIDGQRKTLDEMLRRYTDLHPDVVATKQLIAQLEAERTQLVASRAKMVRAAPGRSAASNPVYQQLKLSLADHEASIASLRAKGSELQIQLNALRASANRVPQVEAEMAQMNRDYEILRRNYEELVRRRESAVMSEGVDATAGLADFRVIDPPRVSPTPVFPNRAVLIPLVLLGSIAAGLLACLALSQAFPMVHDTKTLRDTARRPVLGSITRLADRATLVRERMATAAFAVGIGGLVIAYSAWLTWMSVNPRV
jgi:polysaccharide chain length determinant protein (PEP-CTERM system associated)